MKILTMLIAAALTSCGGARPEPLIRGFPSGTLLIESGDRTVPIPVEIAETDTQRATGLMGISELPEDTGMVFLFDQMHQGPFHMEDTLIPLDIAFWDDGGRVVDVLLMTPCDEDPCPLYKPDSPYTGALEMAAGSMKRLGIREGSEVTLRRSRST